MEIIHILVQSGLVVYTIIHDHQLADWGVVTYQSNAVRTYYLTSSIYVVILHYFHSLVPTGSIWFIGSHDI